MFSPIASLSVDGSAPPPPYALNDPHASAVRSVSRREQIHEDTSPLRHHTTNRVTKSCSSNPPSAAPSSSQKLYLQNRQLNGDTSSFEHAWVEHRLYFDAELTPTAFPFPQPADTFIRRGVTGRDWALFTRCIFSLKTSSAAKGSKKAADKHEYLAGEDLALRRAHIISVIAEWNQGFFKACNIYLSPCFGAPQSFALAHASSPPELVLLESKSPFHASSADKSRNVAPPSAISPSACLHDRRNSHSSMSSSSISSASSIESSDLNHATIPEIRSLLTAFRAHALEGGRLRKSVHDLRHQLRSQHIPMSSSDPKAHLPNTKNAKKDFQQARKELRKEIKCTIKEIRANLIDEQRARRAERRQYRSGQIVEAGCVAKSTSSAINTGAASGMNRRWRYARDERNVQTWTGEHWSRELANRSMEETKDATWCARQTAANTADNALAHAHAALQRAPDAAIAALRGQHGAKASSRAVSASGQAQNTAH